MGHSSQFSKALTQNLIKSILALTLLTAACSEAANEPKNAITDKNGAESVPAAENCFKIEEFAQNIRNSDDPKYRINMIRKTSKYLEGINFRASFPGPVLTYEGRRALRCKEKNIDFGYLTASEFGELLNE